MTDFVESLNEIVRSTLEAKLQPIREGILAKNAEISRLRGLLERALTALEPLAPKLKPGFMRISRRISNEEMDAARSLAKEIEEELK